MVIINLIENSQVTLPMDLTEQTFAKQHVLYKYHPEIHNLFNNNNFK